MKKTISLILISISIMLYPRSIPAQSGGPSGGVQWPATPNPVVEIVIVGIDSDTLYYLGPDKDKRTNEAYMGPYPIHRTWHGRLVNRLREAGARLIAFDILFQQTWQTRDDKVFSDAIAAGPPPVIVGFDIIPRPYNAKANVSLKPYALARIPTGLSAGRQAPALALPFEGLIRSGALAACRTDRIDDDGVMRRSDLFVEYNNMALPTMPLYIFLQAIGASAAEAQVGGAGSSRALVVRGRGIPLDVNDTFKVTFPPHGAVFKFVSFYDVIKVKDEFKQGAEENHKKKMKELFNDRIVIVGFNDATLGDLVKTEKTDMGAYYPGVEAMAATVNHMLNLYAGANWKSSRPGTEKPDNKKDVDISIEKME